MLKLHLPNSKEDKSKFSLGNMLQAFANKSSPSIRTFSGQSERTNIASRRLPLVCHNLFPLHIFFFLLHHVTTAVQ